MISSFLSLPLYLEFGANYSFFSCLSLRSPTSISFFFPSSLSRSSFLWFSLSFSSSRLCPVQSSISLCRLPAISPFNPFIPYALHVLSFHSSFPFFQPFPFLPLFIIILPFISPCLSLPLSILPFFLYILSVFSLFSPFPFCQFTSSFLT